MLPTPFTLSSNYLFFYLIITYRILICTQEYGKKTCKSIQIKTENAEIKIFNLCNKQSYCQYHYHLSILLKNNTEVTAVLKLNFLVTITSWHSLDIFVHIVWSSRTTRSVGNENVSFTSVDDVALAGRQRADEICFIWNCYCLGYRFQDFGCTCYQ